MNDTPSAAPGDGRSWKARAKLAFLIAPVSLGLVVVWLPGGLWALMFSAAVGYPIAAVIGLPTFFLSRAIGWTGIWSYALLALVCSVVVIAGLVVWPALSQGESLSELLSSSARWAQISVAVAVVTISVGIFWLIARPDRP